MSRTSKRASKPERADGSKLDEQRARRVSFVLTVVVGALVLSNGLFVIRLLWNHLNYVQIDHAGHIASAAAFGRGEYHEFSDQSFLGSIHGLFYPPLQDLILSVINWIAGQSHVLGYKIYLSVLVIAYLGAILLLVVRFKSRLARACLLGGLLFLLNIEKPELVSYQGLSFADLWLTGLSTEILAAVFLFLLIREWLGPARSRWLCGWLALILISHLVVGFVALILMAAAWTQERQRGIAIAIAGALGLSAFFWIPFVVNRSTITSSNILLTNPLLFAATAAVGLWLGLRNRKARTLFAIALVLLAPLIVGPWLSELGVGYPRFHYYRFAIIAVFLILIGYAVLIESLAPEAAPWMRRSLYVALVVVGVVGVRQFRLQRYGYDWPSLTPSDVQVADPHALELPEYGRFWVIGDARSVDFGIDSMLVADHPEFRSTKGLFWESYRHNTVLSSWYATLLGTPVVLDYFHYYGYGCEVNACLFDQFVHDYNIGGLIVDERLPLSYATAQRRECYRQILSNHGTASYELVEQGTVTDAARIYTVFRIASRGRLSNSAVEPIAISQLTPFDSRQDGYYAEAIKSVFTSCTTGAPAKTFIEERDLAEVSRLGLAGGAEGAPSKVSFTKQAAGVFEVKIDSPEPILFRIKLAYLPGVELVSERGPEPLFEGMSGMIGYGHGRMELHYRRPAGVVLGYVVSLLVALGLLARLIWSWRRARVTDDRAVAT